MFREFNKVLKSESFKLFGGFEESEESEEFKMFGKFGNSWSCDRSLYHSPILLVPQSPSPPLFFQRNAKYFFLNLNLINTNHL